MTIFTIKEIADYLCISKVSAYRFVKSGVIPAKKLKGKWIIIKEVVDKKLFDERSK